MKINIPWKYLVPLSLLLCAVPIEFLVSFLFGPRYFILGFWAAESMIFLGLILLAIAVFANVAHASIRDLAVRSVILGFLVNTLIFLGEMLDFRRYGWAKIVTKHDYGFPFRFFDNSVGFGGEISPIGIKVLWLNFLLDTIFWAVIALLTLGLVRYFKNRFFQHTVIKPRTTILVAVVVILGIFGTNYFIYDFTPSACDYKSITVDKRNYKLSSQYDLEQIANEMNKKSEYTTKYLPHGGGVTDSLLEIYRFFGPVEYVIVFPVYDSTQYYGLATKSPTDEEIKCSTPDYKIRNNVKRMINDLPVSSAQKNELKNHIEIERLRE